MMNGAGKRRGMAAGALAALLALSCGGGGGRGEEAAVAERIAVPPGARIYVHGEAVGGDTVVVAWSAAGDATLNGRSFAARPHDFSRDGDEDLRARYGRVPMVRSMTKEGKSLAEAVGAFAARQDEIRHGLSAAYETARGDTGEEEATRAALAALSGEDRALLESDPVAGAGIALIHFAGRPPETWILRSAGRAGLPRPGGVGREGALAIAGKIREVFAAPDGAALVVLGDENRCYGGADEVARAAAQIAAAGEGRLTAGPLPPKALAEFLPVDSGG